MFPYSNYSQESAYCETSYFFWRYLQIIENVSFTRLLIMLQAYIDSKMDQKSTSMVIRSSLDAISRFISRAYGENESRGTAVLTYR